MNHFSSSCKFYQKDAAKEWRKTEMEAVAVFSFFVTFQKAQFLAAQKQKLLVNLVGDAISPFYTIIHV